MNNGEAPGAEPSGGVRIPGFGARVESNREARRWVAVVLASLMALTSLVLVAPRAGAAGDPVGTVELFGCEYLDPYDITTGPKEASGSPALPPTHRFDRL